MMITKGISVLKQTKVFGLLSFLACSSVFSQEIKPLNFKILNAIEAEKGKLAPSTKKWMKKWKDMNLEDTALFTLAEISGTTSINIKVQKKDATDEKGYKSYGSFVTTNEAANPNAEIAYFNLAAIVGADSFYRPAVRYELGPKAKVTFKKVLTATPVKGVMRTNNKKNILKALEKPVDLRGCVKAKKEDFSVELEDMVGPSVPGMLPLKATHPVVKFIRGNSVAPKRGDTIQLKNLYIGDALTLSREFSIMMTLDVVFGQYDRLSGGNVVIMKDENQVAHYYATDNGGAYVVASTGNALKTAKSFSRFDKKTILKLQELHAFLQNPALGFLGYKDAKAFVVDLGLYFDMTPERYVGALKDNLTILLNRVKESEKQYGSQAYFPEE